MFLFHVAPTIFQRANKRDIHYVVHSRNCQKKKFQHVLVFVVGFFEYHPCRANNELIRGNERDLFQIKTFMCDTNKQKNTRHPTKHAPDNYNLQYQTLWYEKQFYLHRKMCNKRKTCVFRKCMLNVHLTHGKRFNRPHPYHNIQVATNNKLTQLGTNWFRTKWIKNESTCV